MTAGLHLVASMEGGGGVDAPHNKHAAGLRLQLRTYQSEKFAEVRDSIPKIAESQLAD